MNNYPEKDTPKILYKYRTLNEFCMSMLRNGEIYFATVAELNDENEYSFRFTDGDYALNENNELVYLSADQLTDRMLSSVKRDSNRGILSLCESSHEIKMWEQYADNFNGICIGFDWDQFGLFFDGSYPSVRNFPRRVVYRSLSEVDTRFVPPNKWLEIFTSKLPEFSFEKEWRMFYKAKQYSHLNVRMAIREIIFGYGVSEDDRNLVRKMISDLPNAQIYSVFNSN